MHLCSLTHTDTLVCPSLTLHTQQADSFAATIKLYEKEAVMKRNLTVFGAASVHSQQPPCGESKVAAGMLIRS